MICSDKYAEEEKNVKPIECNVAENVEKDENDKIGTINLDVVQGSVSK